MFEFEVICPDSTSKSWARDGITRVFRPFGAIKWEMVIKLDMPEIKELLKLLRRANANINQIDKHLHETGRVYDTDLEEILGYQKEIYKGQNELLTKLSKLQ